MSPLWPAAAQCFWWPPLNSPPPALRSKVAWSRRCWRPGDLWSGTLVMMFSVGHKSQMRCDEMWYGSEMCCCTSLAFCSVSGVIEKSTGFGCTFDFCGWTIMLISLKASAESIFYLFECEKQADLRVHHKFTSLAQVFGQQRASHITAKCVLLNTTNTQSIFTNCKHYTTM